MMKLVFANGNFVQETVVIDGNAVTVQRGCREEGPTLTLEEMFRLMQESHYYWFSHEGHNDPRNVGSSDCRW
jgi:hypothetical protein